MLCLFYCRFLVRRSSPSRKGVEKKIPWLDWERKKSIFSPDVLLKTGRKLLWHYMSKRRIKEVLNSRDDTQFFRGSKYIYTCTCISRQLAKIPTVKHYYYTVAYVTFLKRLIQVWYIFVYLIKVFFSKSIGININIKFEKKES